MKDCVFVFQRVKFDFKTMLVFMHFRQTGNLCIRGFFSVTFCRLYQYTEGGDNHCLCKSLNHSLKTDSFKTVDLFMNETSDYGSV